MPETLSRQRRYQIRRKQDGNCETCGRIEFKAGECRRCYVLRAMRRLSPDQASELTRFVLGMWNAQEMYGLEITEPESLPANVERWIAKWDSRIGGN